MTALVVESAIDAALLRPLLSAADLDGVKIKIAGGKSSALSLGPSIASAQGGPVAILVDGDTVDRRVLKQQKLIFVDLQRGIAPSASCELFLAAPTLEEDLFPSADEFESIYGLKLEAHERDSFAADRKTFLQRWFTRVSRRAGRWPGAVDPAGAHEGWGHPLLEGLLSFLHPGFSPLPAP